MLLQQISTFEQPWIVSPSKLHISRLYQNSITWKCHNKDQQYIKQLVMTYPNDLGNKPSYNLYKFLIRSATGSELPLASVLGVFSAVIKIPDSPLPVLLGARLVSRGSPLL